MKKIRIAATAALARYATCRFAVAADIVTVALVLWWLV